MEKKIEEPEENKTLEQLIEDAPAKKLRQALTDCISQRNTWCDLAHGDHLQNIESKNLIMENVIQKIKEESAMGWTHEQYFCFVNDALDAAKERMKSIEDANPENEESKADEDLALSIVLRKDA